MADMTPLADILNGDDADATPVQNNFQTLETYINGTDLVRTDGTEAMTADLDLDSNKVVNLATPTADADAATKEYVDDAVATFQSGAWTSWTPTVTQSGSVTVTNTRSRYARFGRTIHFSANVSVTGTGSAGNAVEISLPVAAASSGEPINGYGRLWDNSTSTVHQGRPWLQSTTTLRIYNTGDGAFGLFSFTAALAASDVIQVYGTYEAAA